MVGALYTLPHRPPQPKLLPGDIQRPSDQYGVTATTVAELVELVGLIEQDPDLNVVVFDSANPDFYLAHYDTERRPGPHCGAAARSDRTGRLARRPGTPVPRTCREHRVDPRHTGGAGTEFVLACDLRFASRKNTLLGHLDPRGVSSPTAVLRPGSQASSVADAHSRFCSWPRSRRAERRAVWVPEPVDRRRPARRRGRGDSRADSRGSITTLSRTPSRTSTG